MTVPDKLKKFTDHNIFTDIGDGVFYSICYGLIPITVTAFSLISSLNDPINLVYLYVTIFVSALGCIYDMTSRYKQTREAFLRGKLILLSIPSFIIGGYCVIITLGMLITSDTQYRCDMIMLSYILSIIIVFIDLIILVIKNAMMKEQVEKEVKE